MTVTLGTSGSSAKVLPMLVAKTALTERDVVIDSVQDVPAQSPLKPENVA